MYHPRLCKQSLEKLEKIVDLLLVVALERFEIDKKDISDKMKNYGIRASHLVMFNSRD